MVYLGKCVATGESVAIKKIKKRTRATQSAAQDQKQLKILQNEVHIMRKIYTEVQGNNLILMKDVFEDLENLYLVLEVLAGGELFDRIVDRGHYTEEDASQLVRKLVIALKSLHDHGIIHRDMKPENLLFTSKDEAAECKITDFGLATVLDDEAAAQRRLVGTPGYVAPEVLATREYGPACDIWGMGVILYILLVGYPPFYADDNTTLFEIIKRGEYEFHEDAWGGITSAAKELVRKMLTVDVSKRPTSEEVLAHPWITDHMPEDHLAGTLTRMKKFNAKRKFRAAAMACILGTRMYSVKPRLRNLLDGADFGLTVSELRKVADAFSKSCGKNVVSPVYESHMNPRRSLVGWGGAGGRRWECLFVWPHWEGWCLLTVLHDVFVMLRGSTPPSLCAHLSAHASQYLISSESFQQVMSALGFGRLPLPRVFDVFDNDGDGHVDYRELVLGVSMLKQRGDDAIKLCFDLYDLDGSGFITRDELAKVIGGYGGEQVAGRPVGWALGWRTE